MAIVVPNIPPVELGGTHSENDFWKALRDELSDEFLVIYGLPFLTRDAVQGEVDFLVLHRELGLLLIECKGKGVYRGHDGLWYRSDHRGRRSRMNKAPSDQAMGHLQGVVSRLGTEATRVLGRYAGGFPLVYGWALAFPYTRRKDVNLPPGLQEAIVFGSRDIGRLEARVREAFSFYLERHRGPAKRLRKQEFDRFVWDGILRPFEGEANIAGQLDHERQRFVTLSKGQAEVIRSLLANRRLAVSGGAGTGKTILAMYGARLLAERGERVLVTCFNAGLAEQLRRVCASWGELEGEVEVAHFHGLCVDIVGAKNLEFPESGATSEEHRRFWAEEAPFELLQALEGDSRGRWDAIIVDEAQDFYHQWWPIIETGLVEGGRLAIFFDERQAIFEHASPVPTEGKTVFELRVNFRNTKAICEVVSHLGRIDLVPHEGCPQGEAPTAYQQPGPKKTRRQVGELLTSLVEAENCELNEIVILAPRSPSNSSIQGARELGGQPIVHDVGAWLAGEGVLQTSISAFKGMDADIVILIDIDPDHELCAAHYRYVAASRAKLRLHVYGRGNWLEIND